MSDFKIEVLDLKESSADLIRILVVQPQVAKDNFSAANGLLHLQPSAYVTEYVESALDMARRHTVNLVVFPELSVPLSSVESIQAWANDNNAVVLAGSHYHKENRGMISRCPIVTGRKVVFTEKIVPAPFEVSPIHGDGLIENILRLKSYKNSLIILQSSYMNSV